MRVPCYLRTQHFSFLFPPSMSLFFLMNLRWIKYFSCYFRNFIMLQSHFLLRQLSHISSLLTSTCRYNLLKYNYNCLGFVISKIRCLMFLMFHALLLLQSGSFDLVGTIVYEIDQHPYQSIFYNGTIEVVEAGGFLSIESVFLFTLGIALVGLLFSWIYGQIQNLSKVSNSVPSVDG